MITNNFKFFSPKSVFLNRISRYKATRCVLKEIMPSYKEAIEKLNKLQSNLAYIQNLKLANIDCNTKLPSVRKYLVRSGVTLDELHTLPVLHVTGTKGKGSTCAFVESILRHHGLNTGFYSSPHLIEVRERIRINGIPISKLEFTNVFNKIYNELETHKENEDDMPLYFRFLTIMAFHVFLRHKVDVAIIEVGIGGEYDCTNIVTNVPVAGITSLGMDHTNILGNTLAEIAWNKSGIMKKNSLVYTVPQFDEAYQVLKQRSEEKMCSLNVVSNDQQSISFIQDYPWSLQTNINLAIKLAEAWVTGSTSGNNNCILKDDILREAIKKCVWPGRYDIRRQNNLRYFIDGAHTFESFVLCQEWFINNIKNDDGKKGLIFNLTGNRSCEDFISLFAELHFDTICFVPNQTRASISNDNINYTNTTEIQVQNCNNFKKLWLNRQKPKYDEFSDDTNTFVFRCVDEAMEYFEKEGKYNILVTGSLHLVGALLSILDPDLNGALRD